MNNVIENLINELIVESIGGESWIDSSGYSIDADNDYNHEGYVLELIWREVAEKDELNVNLDSEYIDMDEVMQKMIKKHPKIPRIEGKNQYDSTLKYLTTKWAKNESDKAGYYNDLYLAAMGYNNMDARLFGMKYYNYIRQASNNFQCYDLNDSKLANIGEFICSYGDVEENDTVNIEDLMNNKYYSGIPATLFHDTITMNDLLLYK